jgi:flavodoxin
MKSLVLYDSVFGNTASMAGTVQSILEKRGEAVQMTASEFKREDLQSVDLLVLGSPTRAFEPTKALVQACKAMNAEDLKRVKVAVFDTRMDIAGMDIKILKLFTKMRGYAADTMTKLMSKKGGLRIGETMGFIVEKSEGPLRDGEMERAAQWINDIADQWQSERNEGDRT